MHFWLLFIKVDCLSAVELWIAKNEKVIFFLNRLQMFCYFGIL